MKNKTTILLALLVLSMMMLGCAGQREMGSTKSTSSTSSGSDRTGSPEDVLVREISDGKLVEVYDEFVRVAPGNRAKNWMIISNVKETTEEFTVYPCSGCDFEERVFEIGPGEYEIVRFKVAAMEGQKDIKVKDKHNNAYGYASISVIVE